jgi:chaperonin GroEL
MAKLIKYGDEARKSVFTGMEMVAKAVMVTMGPKGKNVLLAKSYGSPVPTNDGVTVAKEIDFEDPYHNAGAAIVKEAADKTNKQAGDGTTTTTTLLYGIANEWQRYIRAGVNPFALSKGLHKGVDKIIEELALKATQVSNKEEIKQVASISAQDEEVGQLIADIIDEVGKDGVISVEEWKSMGLTKEVVIGMQFDQWYGSPYFVSDSQRMEAVLEQPYILITDKKISTLKDIIGILEALASSGRKNIVIIADDVEGEALTSLVLNKMRWAINVLTIKAPGFGDRKKELLKDIAAVTGAIVITEELGLKLEEATIDMLGGADKVVASKDKTTIVGWKGDTSDIDERVAEINVHFDRSTSEYDREKLMERKARLVWGVAVIKVGAATEMEMKNKKYKIEDALNATRAAVEEGIVPWGWVTLANIAKSLENFTLDDADEHIGIEILKAAIQYPVKQIADNAGYKGDWVVEAIKAQSDFNYGFDAKTGEFKNMLTAGIIDPAKVLRVSLENAVSAAAMFLTTDAIVVDAPKKDDPILGGAGAMWWMGGMWGMDMY